MTDSNVALMYRVYDVMNSGDMDLADEIIAEDLIDHEVPGGMPNDRQGWKAWVGVLRTAFPDLHIDIDDTIAQDDKVVVRGTFSGTHEGDFMGMPPTGKHFSVEVIDIGRFENGMAVEHWGLTDSESMMEQLGLS